MEERNKTLNREGKFSCPIEFSFGLIARKWMLPVLCELNKNGVMRYGELKRAVSGVTNMALTQVLKDLVMNDIVQRIQFNEVPPHVEYSLTEEGKKLIPALYSMAKWGLKQMDVAGRECTCSEKCYVAYHEYIPLDKEAEVLEYPETYNKRYLHYYDEIIKSSEKEQSVSERLNAFLIAMLRTLTEDGEDSARWAMMMFFRNDTPNFLQKGRPQYKILYSLIEEGKEKKVLKTDMKTEYIVEMLSKVITGCIGDWQMEKCSYDVIEQNRDMIQWVCHSLFKEK